MIENGQEDKSSMSGTYNDVRAFETAWQEAVVTDAYWCNHGVGFTVLSRHRERVYYIPENLIAELNPVVFGFNSVEEMLLAWKPTEVRYGTDNQYVSYTGDSRRKFFKKGLLDNQHRDLYPDHPTQEGDTITHHCTFSFQMDWNAVCRHTNSVNNEKNPEYSKWFDRKYIKNEKVVDPPARKPLIAMPQMLLSDTGMQFFVDPISGVTHNYYRGILEEEPQDGIVVFNNFKHQAHTQYEMGGENVSIKNSPSYWDCSWTSSSYKDVKQSKELNGPGGGLESPINRKTPMRIEEAEALCRAFEAAWDACVSSYYYDSITNCQVGFTDRGTNITHLLFVGYKHLVREDIRPYISFANKDRINYFRKEAIANEE